MKNRIVLVLFGTALLLEGAEVYRLHLKVAVMSVELYGQPDPLKQLDMRVPDRLNRLEDLEQVTGRVAERVGVRP